jgi:plasmid replication initiation protein
MAKRNPPPGEVQLKLFSALFTDIATRDTQDTMEVPFLSLSKRRFKSIRYNANGVEVTVTGGEPYGIATIWDWDLIMWLLSQIRQALDNGEEVSRKIRFHRSTFLKDARRAAGGAQYKRLEESITRLKNTNIVTTIRAKHGRTVMFSWIEYAEIGRDEKGQLQDAVVVIPTWLFEAICTQTLVLTLHPDYFLLTGGLERWLYRLIRKQAGNNPQGWNWKFTTLHNRSGSTQRFSDFSRDLRKILAAGEILDYEIKELSRNGEACLHAQKKKNRSQQKSY